MATQKHDLSSSPAGKLPVPTELIDRRIYIVRGRKVMLDADLAELYRVLTKNLNLAVRRNLDRFPEDFMFQLTEQEYESLRCTLQPQTSAAAADASRASAFTPARNSPGGMTFCTQVAAVP